MDDIKLELEFGTKNSEDNNNIEEITKEDSLLNALTVDEQKQIKDFVEKIDVLDSNLVLTYGNASQNKIAQFSDAVLKDVKTKDSGAAGKLLTDLVVEIQEFDALDDKGGIFKLFNSVKKTISSMVASYNKIEANIEKIVGTLESHQRQLLKDITIFDDLYDNNLVYYKELNMYIIAGKEKLKDINENVIPALKRKAEETGEQLDAQALNDMINAANRFEKKIHDLQLSKTISVQMAPQIRLIQNNDAQLVDKIQSSIVNSIPLWKNQVVIALGISNSKAALDAQKKVTDMTNTLLMKNSELLKQGSLEIAKESEEGIVSLETLHKTNQNLIETINGVLEIQKQGHIARENAEIELLKIENELKSAMLETIN